MAVKSLYDLATMACLKNIREVLSVGDYLSYPNVRHILLKVDSAHQLRTIEVNSPQLQGETGEIWLKLIEKEFPMEYKAKAYKPSNPDKWFRVYEKYKRDHDNSIQESQEKLMNAFAGLQENKEKNISRIVEQRALKQAGKLITKRPTGGWGQRDGSTSTLNFNRGSRTKTSTGASVMRRVRREAKEVASIHGTLSRPVRGSAGLTKVDKAPPAMVNDYHRAAQPDFRPTKPEPPSALQEYEERATVLSESDEEDDDDDVGALFDQEEKSKKPVPSKPIVKPVRSAAKYAATSLLKSKRPYAGAPPPSNLNKNITIKKVVVMTPNGSGSPSNGSKGPSSSPSISSGSAPNVASSVTTGPEPSKSDDDIESPPRKAASPPASSMSPPPATATPLQAMPRKRKAVDIFMKPKRRA